MFNLSKPALFGAVGALVFAVGVGVFFLRPVNSVMDGVFTLEQAARGQDLYPFTCPRCHHADLGGDGFETPSLASSEFTRRWDGRTVADLFLFVSQNMPANNPGMFDDRAYIDLIAFILRFNGYPTGRKELPADPEYLARIRMEMLR